MAKKLIFDPALRQDILKGSQVLQHVVQSNFGPVGRNTMREQAHDLPLIANTGRRILEDFSLEEPAESLAAILIRDAALQVAQEYGDGSITTAIITDSLLSEGYRLITAGYEPMALRKGMQQALPLIREYLDEITIPFDSISAECFALATAKNEEVAENVVRAFQQVGVDGTITIQDTQGRETILKLWDGARYDYGLMDACFINDPEHRRTVLNDPFVLLSNIKINSIEDIRKMLEDVIRSGSSLLIIAREMEDEVQRILAANVARGLKVAVAKAPGYGDTRRRNMLALAAKTGALLFDENTGRRMCECGLECCARIRRAEVDKENTILQGFTGASEEMVSILRKHTLQELDNTTDHDEREKLLTTLSILNGTTAEILVGGVVEYEMFEKKYLYENTVRTMQNAARSGLVPGAGNAYVYVAKRLQSAIPHWPEGQRLGAQCLADVLGALAGVLASNAGDEGAVVTQKLTLNTDPYIGYDVLSHQMLDLKQAGILIPRNTAEAIIRIAADTAGALWTTAAALIET